MRAKGRFGIGLIRPNVYKEGRGGAEGACMRCEMVYNHYGTSTRYTDKPKHTHQENFNLQPYIHHAFLLRIQERTKTTTKDCFAFF